IEADARIDLTEERVPDLGVRDVDPGDEQMARVEAESEPFVASERVEDALQLVDGPADRPPGAGGVLHQQPRAVVATVENLLDRRDDTLEARVEDGADMRAHAAR